MPYDSSRSTSSSARDLYRNFYLLLFAITGNVCSFADEEVSLETIQSEIVSDEIAKADKKVLPPTDLSATDGYTINYNTVSIIEYIRFASKICNVNFLFNEEDLQFSVTVVSDAPVTAKNVMATLVQMLRIHGLMFLEQGNSLVIHKCAGVRQMATLVFEDGAAGNAPIVTRVFRLKNANPDSISAIIRPMISEEALLEVSHETRQLIVTDVTASIDKIALLIENLDSPHTPLEISSYETKFNHPEYLINLASQIMMPIAQGMPFIMVPQALANSIYIVSTPEMNSRAAKVLASLDIPPKKSFLSERRLASGTVFIAKLQYRQSNEVLASLKSIVQRLQESGLADPDLLGAIDSAEAIPETNSLMFVGSNETNAKLREFIGALDVPNASEGVKLSFFVYTPQYRSAESIQKAMLETAAGLEQTKGASQGEIDAIRSMKVNSTTHTILFAGDSATFPRIKELLATVDNSASKARSTKPSFYIYKIQSSSHETIETSLKSFAQSLEKAGVADEEFVKTVSDMQYIKETNSLLFTGPDDILKRIQDMIPQFDTGLAQGAQFFIYKPNYQKGEALLQSLRDLETNLQASQLADPAFLRTIESARWVKSTNSLLFTGDAGSIQKLQAVLATLDIPGSAKTVEKNVFLYPPKFASKERIETDLKQIAESLNAKTDMDLLSAIRSAKWIEPSRSFLFHVSDKSHGRLNDILANVDTPEASPPAYFIYKLQNATGPQVEEDVDGLLHNMKATGLKNTPLVKTLETMRYVKETNSFLLTGDPNAVNEAKTVIAQYDTEHCVKGGSHFFMYKPQHLTADAIRHSLQDISSNLQKANLADCHLLTSINSVKYVATTNSLIFTGSSDTIAKIQDLLKEIDLPCKDNNCIQHVGATTFLLYKLKNAGGVQITASLQGIATDLKKSHTTDKDFLAALNSMKYVRETNSLMFTGTEEALTKVQTLVEKFDVSSLAAPSATPATTGPTQFFIYKPQALPAEDLEKTLIDFAQNLKLGGLNDPNLFNAIASMKYIEKTESLVFTGA